MGKEYEKATRTALHQTQEKFNKKEQELRQELQEAKQFIKILRMFFAIFGLGIMIFDLIKDSICESQMLRYNLGMGWQQWLLFAFGAILLLIGIYRNPK